MGKIVDWITLKTEYQTGDTKSVSEFLKQKGIKLNGNTSRQIKGWVDDREQFQIELQKKMLDKSQEKLTEVFVDDITEMRLRHSKIAKYIQTKALQTLQRKDFDTAYQAVRALATGVQEERGIVGMDNQSNMIVSPEVQLAMKTRYYDKIKDMNFDELIQVLQRLKELEQNEIDVV